MYRIEARYMEGGSWQREVTTHEGTMEEAWRQASSIATRLDRLYSNGHFWTVDLKNENGESYVQLFHGRLQ